MPSAFRSALAAFTLIAATSIAGVLAQPPSAVAQTAEIVVTVNEDIITNVDVDQRARLLAFGAGRDVPNARSRAAEALIDDALKLQEAARLGVEVTADEVAQAIGQIARNNNITAEQLLGAMESAGIERWAFERQLRAELAWTKIIRGRYGDSLDPSEIEIEAALSNTASDEDVYALAQIVVRLEQNAPQSQVEETMARVQEVRTAMTSCETVLNMAQSLGPPSGDIGQTQVNQMPPPVREQVTTLDVGEITEPIRSNVGVHLIMVCGVDRAGAANRDRIVAALRQQKGERISASYVGELRRNALITQMQ